MKREWQRLMQVKQEIIQIKKQKVQYIAGTRDSQDVFDWWRIPTGMYENSKMYKNAEKL